MMQNSYAAKNWPLVIGAAKGTTCGALALQVWELFSSFTDEVDLIWRHDRTITAFLYVWLRYFPLVIQIINLVLSEYLNSGQPRPKICFIFMLAKIVSGQTILSCVEIVMTMRVYMLYNRTRRVKYFLGTVYTIGLFLETFARALVIVRLHGDERACIMEPIEPAPLIIFSTGLMVIQGTLVTMTCLRSFHTRQWSWLRTPLAGLILRDPLIISLFLLVVSSAVYTVETLPPPLWNAASAWYISVLSIAGCQLILGMRKLMIRYNLNGESGELQLTSIVMTDSADISSQ